MLKVCSIGVGVSLVLLTIFPLGGFGAADSPSSPSQALASSPVQKGDVRDRMYYGYVPPPPIRHTWPGGYKVIFHEIFHTLADHIRGNY